MPISALDNNTVKLIKTTQVITSIYSVVKELFENSLDAKAQNIDVNLVNDGLSLIEIKDDGQGIPKEEVQYAVLSSYTSKITNYEDLDRLQSYGFRGEALHALCNVANLILVTKTEQDEVAKSYTIDHDGNIIKIETCYRPTGTTIQVKNLFNTMPVRRQAISNKKCLKETIKIVGSLLESFGICQPAIRICYRVNNSIVFIKPSSHSMREVLLQILGKKIMDNMNWIEYEDEVVKLLMMIPSKNVQDILSLCQVNQQYIFVNRRPVKFKELEKILIKRISEYFSNSFLKKKPIFLLNILVDQSKIDVNLEPNKDIILLQNQEQIFSIIDSHLMNYYKLQPSQSSQNSERTEEKIEDDFEHEYQDNSLMSNVSNSEVEWQVCKKRKISIDKEILITEKDSTKIITNNSMKNDSNEIYKNKNLILSESDTDEEMVLTLPDDDLLKTNSENMEQPYTQIPDVDLGEDFDIETILENKEEKYVRKSELMNDGTEKPKTKITEEEWSKGQVSGIKGSTDVKSFNSTTGTEFIKVSDLTLDKVMFDTYTGFSEYTKEIRPQILKEQPTLSAIQIAQKIANMWRNLSSEERGFFRDLAIERKSNINDFKNSRLKDKKNNSNPEENKKKFLDMLKNMKKKSNSNLMVRSTIPWTVTIDKVKKRFSNKVAEPFIQVIGRLNTNLWIIQNSTQMWIVDIVPMLRGLDINNINVEELNWQDVTKFYNQWVLEKNDMSMIHPFYTYL